MIRSGDIVTNIKGWQGKVIQVTKTKRFGAQCLVQYASMREWETESSLLRVVAVHKKMKT